MLKEIEQIEELAATHDLEATRADVVQTLTEDELIELLPEFDAWIAGDDPATRRVLEAGRAGRLRSLVKWGVGIDNIDQEAAASLGLAFANTPGMFNDEVADLAYGYLINLVRHVNHVDAQVRQGNWPKPQGTSLRGKRAAVVGLGNIGLAIVDRLRVSGVEVTGYDPYAGADDRYVLRSWPDGLAECDFLVLCCALTADNQHLVNADSLALLKPGARIVNVSRGPLVDESALLEALRSGHIGGAALDVFEEEPPAPTNPLLALEQCIFGSHNASNTREAVRATNARAMELVRQHL